MKKTLEFFERFILYTLLLISIYVIIILAIVGCQASKKSTNDKFRKEIINKSVR
ncbi:MAG: hypothetical protein R2764_01380 [Bacteroidales bacterium]